jgi:hypothetical protein
MTPDLARKLLEDWINAHQIEVRLPIVDEVVYQKTSFDAQETIMQQYTFKALIKIAYNLKDDDC